MSKDKTYSVINNGKNLKIDHIVDNIFTFTGDIEVTDSYHTMSELYKHRLALNVALFNRLADDEFLTIFKAKKHHDKTMFDGYFIVMLINHLDDDKQISYHYDLKYWDMFRITEHEVSPYPYDGHTPEDTIERLMKL